MPPAALTTAMPLPVVCPPRPFRFVTCTVVVPLALPVTSSLSVTLELSPSTVPTRSRPLLPT
ncbi:Uncharacterised protein [Xylophilus ampelinus]|nr:Uncharacterised protein [Xylophilus ampelinus]